VISSTTAQHQQFVPHAVCCLILDGRRCSIEVVSTSGYLGIIVEIDICGFKGAVEVMRRAATKKQLTQCKRNQK